MATQVVGNLTPQSIFINHLDTYISSNVGKKLLASVFNKKAKTEEETEFQEEDDFIAKNSLGDFKNNIFCTLTNVQSNLKYPSTVVDFDKWTELYSKIKSCKYFIYNIIDIDSQIDEALWIAEKLYHDSFNFQERKIFILLSTVLTWSRTQYLSDEDENSSFSDIDYRRRKAHPNYDKHIAAEKEIKRLGELNKIKFLTYVIASGVVYGEENDIFHRFLKAGWLNSETLEVIEEGSNIIPTIYIADLASIIYETLNMCPTTHYVLAVDGGNNTQLDIVKAISKNLTTGKVKHISVEEAKLNSGFTQKEIDNLTLDLRLEAQFARENMSFDWANEDGLVNSINKVVSEFKQARGLIPIRICVLGPPLSGKTKLALLLSDYYTVPHIHVKKVIEDRINELEEKVKNSAEEDGETETDSASETEDPLEALEEIQAALFTGKGRLGNSMLCDLVKRRLNSKECQNQGYILDGFPKTKAQADILFGGGEDEEGSEDEAEDEEELSGEESDIEERMDPNTKVAQLESEHNVRENIIPNVTEETTLFNKVNLSPKPNALPSCTIFLQASDIFLFSRALQLPCDEIQHNHNDEEGFMRRLAVYRRAHAGSEVAALMASEELRKALESENLLKIIHGEAGSLNPSEQLAPLMAGSISPNTLLAYFEDKGVSTFNFDVAMDTSGEFDEIERRIEVAIGPPRNYGPITKRTKMREELQMKMEEERRELEQSRAAEELKRRDAQKHEMSSLLESIQAEEDEALQKASKPLREYLGKFVLPTLTKGIFECIWRRPEDPVDYLAEYLFRNNPQVD
ncbi:unnamed protein product [Rodentolepis nana]|uniref:Adenylate kinase 7 n=1 Tax=Rodentolepis nana TaxID=102285 RepID=A0A0R3TT12_RODNA|nr:unnamed protein product [Rodentolepis nana]